VWRHQSPLRVFLQTDGLLLAIFSAWVGLCVYAAGMLDGNRAYAAALYCVTVALIAIQQIDRDTRTWPHPWHGRISAQPLTCLGAARRRGAGGRPLGDVLRTMRRSG
jgi:fusaric acid resistance family protein